MRPLLVAMGALAAATLAIPTNAMPVDQYLKVRRQNGFDPHLSYTQLEGDPTRYAKASAEIRGTVNGTIRRQQSVAFMLAMDGRGSILLTAPQSDTDLVSMASQQRLRVLVRPKADTAWNAVPLEVVAICYDADVAQREQAAAAQEAELARRRAAAAVPGRYVQASRGGQDRQGPMAIAGPGEVPGMARQYLSAEAQAIFPQYRQFIQRCNRRLTTDELDQITVSVLHFSQRYKVDPRLVIAMIIAESDFNPRSTSNKGAMGLGQLMPDEVQALKLPNPYDPVWNIKGAVDLLKGKLDIFRENGTPDGQLTWRQIELALAAYNAGAGAVKRYGGVPPYRETQGYVKKILKIYKELIGT